MSRKVHRVPYTLDAGGVQKLPSNDLEAILRGADDLIMSGGRNLLVKVLRGSRMKKILELELDQSPVYGYFRDLSEGEVLARIDWAILHGYLAIEYDYRLPLLVYTPKGWAIEKGIRVIEFLEDFDEKLKRGPPFDMTYLKDRNRELIWHLLDEVENTGDARYVPLLESWQEIDYKKVRQRIRRVILRLQDSPAPGSYPGASIPRP